MGGCIECTTRKRSTKVVDKVSLGVFLQHAKKICKTLAPCVYLVAYGLKVSTLSDTKGRAREYLEEREN